MKKIRKHIKDFWEYTKDSFKGYIRGLFPKTQIVPFTNPRCRKMLSISKVWMGKPIKTETYELNEFVVIRLKLEKENLPRITEIIQRYEEEHGEITVDKTEKNHI